MMDRRNFLMSAGAFAGSTILLGSASQAEAAEDQGHQHHASIYPAIATAAADCVKTGQVCIDHCLSLLGQGEKALAACARSVQQTMAICSALQQLAVQNSPYLPGLAKVALEACKDCEKECRKHEAKHSQCKDCADACAACAKECKALAV